MVLWDLIEEPARRVAEEVTQQSPKCKTYVYAVDVSKPREVAEKAAAVQQTVGFVSILINNAVRGWPLLFLPGAPAN